MPDGDRRCERLEPSDLCLEQRRKRSWRHQTRDSLRVCRICCDDKHTTTSGSHQLREAKGRDHEKLAPTLLKNALFSSWKISSSDMLSCLFKPFSAWSKPEAKRTDLWASTDTNALIRFCSGRPQRYTRQEKMKTYNGKGKGCQER